MDRPFYHYDIPCLVILLALNTTLSDINPCILGIYLIYNIYLGVVYLSRQTILVF